MRAIPIRLQQVLDLLEPATWHLEIASQNAKDRGYAPNWIDAINKALIDNQATRLHIGNTITCITSRDESRLLAPTEKES